MNPIGIMQGRLLPPIDGKIQAFPVERWAEEFARAADAGLERIEWIYEFETAEANPLASDGGLERVRRLAGESGVGVRSVCADYFMRARLIADGRFNDESAARLRWLVPRCAALGVQYIVLPFVDDSALQDTADVAALARGLKSLLREAEPHRVEYHLETALPPAEFRALLASIDHPLLHANYDIGNSAALGVRPADELPAIGPWLGSVHVKDRRLHGGTVPLGTGDADLDTCFRLLARMGYRGPLILQAARDPAGNEVALARANREFVVRLWSAARVAEVTTR